MKLCLSLFYFLFAIGVHAQKITNNIKTVKTLNIQNGTVSIGKIVIDEKAKTEVYLSAISQEKDTSGFYLTNYKFTSNSKESTFNFEIAISLNQKIIPQGINDFGVGCDGGCIVSNISNYDSTTNTIYTKGNITSKVLIITIKTKTAPFATFYGIDGKLF